MTDQDYLARAAEIAEKSTEEIPCGCVLVRSGKVITAQFNSQHADNMAVNHAEIKAIVSANYTLGKRELTATTAYCTCEPCAMCLTALSYAKVARIVYAKSMAELSPNDPQAKLDSQKFVKGLNFVPVLEHIPA
jgi:tRNA(Arg) A34 adenosine deaminase TadA